MIVQTVRNVAIAIGMIATMLAVTFPVFTIATVIMIKRHGKKHD